MSAHSGAARRAGIAVALGAFMLWGLMPLYWHALKAVPALQVVLHRILWGAVFVCGWLWLRRGAAWWQTLARRPRTLAWLALSGALIAFNWGLYIWGVSNGHVIETSLGYFINPMLNVLVGVVFLHERMRRMQWLSVAIALIGVLWLTLRFGSIPWIALSLACSFSLYGLIRKHLAVDAIAGLGMESAYLFLPALVGLAWLEACGQSGLLSGHGWRIDGLLILGGALTALPLIGFSHAVRTVPLSVIGLLQYVAPTLQFLLGVFVFGEMFDRTRAIGFAFIWTGLLVFIGDGLWRARRLRQVPT